MKKKYDKEYASIEEVQKGFEEIGYICSHQIATTLYLSYHLDKPILVEGPAGVGKTALGQATADYLSLPLIRLQCYEGLDESKALYEWKYGKQLLYTQILKEKLNDVLVGAKGLAASMKRLHDYDDLFFSLDFLEPRPLLEALHQENGAVLLIDEVDKSDQEFEAFLLEILSEYQVSIPEIGTIKAKSKPFVFLTSNNTRELSEALKRRCLHLFIPFPNPKLEMNILKVHIPELSESLAKQLIAFIHAVRRLDLKKVPSVSEVIDWARVLMILHASKLGPELIRDTFHTFLKFEEDIDLVQENIYELLKNDLAQRAEG